MYVGLSAGIDFHENFGFEGELIFNTKGMKNSVEVLGVTTTTKTDLLYLDIPVSVKGMYTVAPSVQVYGKFGPYVGIGLTGKNKIEAESKLLGKKETKTDFKWGSEAGEMNRFDYGLQMGAGIEVGGFLIEGIYKFSLGDIDNMDLSNTKHHVLAISVGYNLGF